MNRPPPADEVYNGVEREAPPSHLLTEMESFSFLLKHKIGILKSTEFESGDYKWQVTMNLDDGDCISVYLSMVVTSSLPEGWEVNAIFTFFQYNHKSDKYLGFQGKARRFNAVNSEWGFPKLLTKKELTEPKNGFLFKDKCVFGAEVFVLKKPPLLFEKVSGLRSLTPYEDEWTIEKFSNNWESEEFSAGGYNWHVLMKPNGQKRVSLSFDCVDAKSFPHGKKLNATCLFTLRNMPNKETNHSKRGLNSAVTATKWFTSTSTSSEIIEFKAVDDRCILEIKLSVLAIHEAPHLTGPRPPQRTEMAAPAAAVMEKERTEMAAPAAAVMEKERTDSDSDSDCCYC